MEFCFQVFAPNCDHWIFVSDNISDQQENILMLLNMHFSSSNLSDNKGTHHYSLTSILCGKKTIFK